MELAIIIVAAIAYLAFRQWLQFNRRMILHRERIAAIEKGVDLPPMEQEVRRSGWNVQRMLLLAGLIWVSLGFGAFVTLSMLLAYHTQALEDIPRGIQWIGVAPVCIGVSHLIVYLVGKKKEG